MASASAEALELKAKGNAAIASKDWKTAVDFYTQAIELDPNQALFYSSKAQDGSVGSAIGDATKAIETDPASVKAYYRRAISNVTLLKYKEALKDFKTETPVIFRSISMRANILGGELLLGCWMCLAPNGKDARLKMNECEKLIRKIEFLKAIEQSDPPSAAEGLDLDSMGVLELAPFFPLRKRKRREAWSLTDSSVEQRVYRWEDKASEFVQRHHNHFFPLDKGDKNGNIAVGTMVENGHGKDIFMVSHAGLQGTVHPTHYMMLHDENILTAVDFQRICNNVCYAYGRATVSVSIAPPVYHANLAAIALALMSAY
ncbi:Piwi domain-domain-containing protein [Tuber borchii]|uniref:Piwi domain-domain-containing protein n=1 Tax=Tuber borchii TaxID=42251 RepID=A0A2T6ZTJ9_TUBBO|nr:Piwi domain-domain-containing protein [Tuber borchii]